MQTVLSSMLLGFLLLSRVHAACPQNSVPSKMHERSQWSELTAFTVSPDAAQAFASAVDGTVMAWDTRNDKKFPVVNCDRYRGSALDFSSERKLLALGDEGGILHLIPLLPQKSPQILQQLGGGGIEQVLFGPSFGSVLAIHQHQIDLWSILTRKVIWSKRTPQELVRAAINPDGKLIAVSNGTGISLLSFATAAPVRDIDLSDMNSFVSDLAFARDGNHLVAAVGNEIKIFDVDTGRVTRTLTGHTDSVIAVTVLDDGKHAISVGEDQTLREWDLRTGTLFSTWDVTPGYVTTNGAYLINRTSHPGELSVWKIQDRKRLYVLSYRSDLDK